MQQFISKGTGPNTNTGTSARDAVDIIDGNFTILFGRFILLNGNVFGFRKAPGNSNTSIEAGDVVYNGFWDANTYWEKAIFISGQPADINNWNVIDLSNGADGDSAYEIWLSEGNTGSPAFFLDSLKGADGQDGQDGAPGPQGAAGADGAAGGPAGPAGANGLSAYEIWIQNGNVGTELEYLESQKAEIGILRLDSEKDKTGQWVIGQHPDILSNKFFIGLSNTAQPTAKSHIDVFLTVK